MRPQDALQTFENYLLENRRAKNTRENYIGHVRRFARFRVPPGTSAEDKICAYLSHLAKKRSPATQKQALNALMTLYKSLGKTDMVLPEWTRPVMRNRIPSWVTLDEALKLIEVLPSPWDELAAIMYGSGLRISEALNLRSKDLCSKSGTISIYNGKGDKSRIVMLSRNMIPQLARRYRINRLIYEQDRRQGRPGVALPAQVMTKQPKAGTRWPWYWIFPAPGESTDPETGIARRHHRHPDGFSKAMMIATDRLQMHKRVTAHSFRHGFATGYLSRGGTIQELMELMGHTSIKTTEIYLHCLPELASRVMSPLGDVVIPFKTISRAA
jgi:integrase